MTQEKFITKMQEDILDTEDEITMETNLTDIEEWDSLALVSFTAMAKMESNRAVDRESVRAAVTIGDLYALLQ